MNLLMRKAEVSDIEGLDLVMQVISDGPGQPEKMAELITHIAKDEQKYLLVAENRDSGEIVGSLYGLAFEDICGGECGCAGEMSRRRCGAQDV